MKIAELVLLPGTQRQQTSQTALGGIGHLSSPVNDCCLGFVSIRVVGLLLVWPRCVRQPTDVWYLHLAVHCSVSSSQTADGLCDRPDQRRSEKCCKHQGSLRSHGNRKGTRLAGCAAKILEQHALQTLSHSGSILHLGGPIEDWEQIHNVRSSFQTCPRSSACNLTLSFEHLNVLIRTDGVEKGLQYVSTSVK